jgi:hypothetical protein
MEKVLLYSVLRYSPSTVAGEKINLGIIFFDKSSNYREFRYSKKFSRLSNFDDEINLELVKALLSGIKNDVEGDLFSYQSFDIYEYTKYYINDFVFEEPKAITYDDLHEIVESLNKTYFRFDYERKNRPTKEDDLKLIERVVRDNSAKVKKDSYVMGACNEKIKFDFVTEDYTIKILDFDKKDLTRVINNMKTWAWNCISDGESKILLIYRYSDDEKKKSDEAFNIIMDIFAKANANILDINKGLQLLQKNN